MAIPLEEIEPIKKAFEKALHAIKERAALESAKKEVNSTSPSLGEQAREDKTPTHTPANTKRTSAPKFTPKL